MDNQIITVGQLHYTVMIDHLLSGAIGAIIATLLSSIVAIYIYRRQKRFESNRHYLDALIIDLQKIYIAIHGRLDIDDITIASIDSFQVISYKELKGLDEFLNKLKKEIFIYRDCIRTQQTTSTSSNVAVSQEEIQAKKTIEGLIFKIMEYIRKVT